MRGKIPVVLAFILSFAALFWCWGIFSQSRELATEYQSKLARCDGLAKEIKKLRNRNENGFKVVEGEFDPTSVSKALLNCGLKTVSIDHSPGPKVADSKIREWIVDIPSTSVTLRQAVDLIQNLAESDANYQVTSLTLTRVNQEVSPIEKWSAEFAIRFLKSELLN